MHEIKVTDSNGHGKKMADLEPIKMPVHEIYAAEPSNKVKVRFEKFVQLVATHDFTSLMKRYAEEDIILSTNLLTDLANAHEEEEVKTSKIPIFFVVGILIGVLITYLIIRF